MSSEDLIVGAMAKAKGRALGFSRRYPNQADRDECISVAYVALVEAASRFEEGREQFWTFAVRRVDGALLDMLRSHSQITSARGKVVYMRNIEGIVLPVQRKFTDTRPLNLAVRMLSARSARIVKAFAARDFRGDCVASKLGYSAALYYWHSRLAFRHLRKSLALRGITKVSDML